MKRIFVLFFLLIMRAAAQVPTNGLVAWYPFNGNANDSSGNGNNGTLHGLTSVPDRFGNPNAAYQFNGTSDYIDVASSASFPSTGITTAFWFNRNGNPPTSPDENYICKDLAFSTYLSDSILYAEVWKGSPGVWAYWSSGNYKVSDDTDWIFYASTFDNSTKLVNIYINGVLVNSVTETDPNAIVRLSSSPLYIGRNTSPVYYINGKLDDVRIYNRALSSNEIQSLYHEGGWDNVPTNGLVAWYPFNGNANDSSGNGNNGTNYGATLTSDRFGNPNSAYLFDGSSSYILVNSSAKFPDTAITTAFWFNRNGNPPTSPDENYICKDLAFSTYLSDSILYAEVWKGSPGVWAYWSSGNYKVSDDTDWIFYASTFDNSTKLVNIYINGVLVDSVTETDPNAIVRSSSSPLYIGRNTSPVYYINGKLDDVRIYNRTLSSKEIQSLYHDGPTTAVKDTRNKTVPEKFTLLQNFPNPFNPSTVIQFTVPSNGRAVLKVFNILGQEVATLFDGVAAAGEYHQATFDASRLASGIYFSRLEFGGMMQVKKLLLMK